MGRYQYTRLLMFLSSWRLIFSGGTDNKQNWEWRLCLGARGMEKNKATLRNIKLWEEDIVLQGIKGRLQT